MPVDVNRAYFVDYVTRRPGGGRVLDYGCGRGETVRELRERGVEAYGADIFFDGMDFSQVQSGELFRERTIRQIAPDGSVPFADSWFELIISDQVLEHVEDLETTASELRRLLAPGGTMLHHFPGLEVWREPHYGVWFSHRLRPPLRRRYLRAARTIGLGGSEPAYPGAREWAEHVDRWLGEFCRFRPTAEIEDRLGGETRGAELDYCRFRARRDDHRLSAAMLSVSRLDPLYAWVFRRLGFSALEVTAVRMPIATVGD